MKVETKIKRLIQLRDEISKEARHWKGDCCPLKMYEDSEDLEKSHYHLSMIFGGLGSYRWECPFCKEEFTE